ncbi:hypothetical protein [Avibacterium endocarditidis]|uniref:Portal protein n=1 Tax=Avibacterium endocarditidis TaxID=380674 RepID=A0ABX4ZRV2_9PAST|nr:hypothetical protein [Avibacterium endocarditidis]POY42236.1 hypothetical protein C3Z13_06900 [Avibacterium endocarditidis]
METSSEKIALPKDEETQEEIHDKLAERVMDNFRIAQGYRARMEIQGKTVESWFYRLYNAYNKIHEPEELANLKNMKTYFGLIQNKANMVSSYIRSKYINHRNPPFDIAPTPIVELPKDKQEQGFERVKAKLTEVVLDNNLPFEALTDGFLLHPKIAKFIEEQSKQAKETLREEEFKIASEATTKMARLIKDQLIEGNFTGAMTEALLDLALYPVMVISYENEAVVDQVWKNDKYEEKIVIRPTFRRVEPSNAYFSPDATNAQDGSFFIELAKRTKAQLAGFIGNETLGYFDEVLKDIIENGDNQWLGIDTNESGTLDNSLLDDEIHILRCQMLVRGADLIDYGVPIQESEKFKYFNADIEVCNHRVIRCNIVAHPKGKRTYFSASYKRVAGEPYGISVGMMVYDRQISINRTQYAMLLNTRYAAGPMLEIDAAAFDSPQDVTMEPLHRVYTNPTKEGYLNGIKQHQITPTFPTLFNQMTNEIRLADDECGLPSFLNGNAGLQGAGQTLGGLAMMTDNAVLGLKDCALNIDEYFIRPAITLIYATNLVTSKDKSIKADAKIVATGLLGLEAELNKSKELAGLVPQAGQIVQQGMLPEQLYRDLVRDYFKSKGIDTDRYMPSDGVQSDLNNIQMQSPTDGLDGRSLRVMQ